MVCVWSYLNEVLISFEIMFTQSSIFLFILGSFVSFLIPLVCLLIRLFIYFLFISLFSDFGIFPSHDHHRDGNKHQSPATLSVCYHFTTWPRSCWYRVRIFHHYELRHLYDAVRQWWTLYEHQLSLDDKNMWLQHTNQRVKTSVLSNKSKQHLHDQYGF